MTLEPPWGAGGERSQHRARTSEKPFAELVPSAAALAGGLVLASSSLAAGSTLYANGLHISTGSIVDPDGRVWVADHNAGFCRVLDPSASSLGRIEHPMHPFDAVDSTCLGGLLAGAGLGPPPPPAP